MKCNQVGSGSREGKMRDELGPGLGPKEGKGSKIDRRKQALLALSITKPK